MTSHSWGGVNLTFEIPVETLRMVDRMAATLGIDRATMMKVVTVAGATALAPSILGVGWQTLQIPSMATSSHVEEGSDDIASIGVGQSLEPPVPDFGRFHKIANEWGWPFW